MLDEEIQKYIKPNMAYFRSVRVVSDQYKNKQTNKQKPYKTYQSTAPKVMGAKPWYFPSYRQMVCFLVDSHLTEYKNSSL